MTKTPSLLKKNDTKETNSETNSIEDIFRTLMLEIMIMSQGFRYEDLTNMSVREFFKWHKESMRLYKITKGIN